MGIARAKNASDEYLLEWEKDPRNPIHFTAAGRRVRNPGSIWWNPVLQHYDLLALSHGGNKDAALGTALMGKMYRYQTTDTNFHNWTRMEVFAQASGMGGQWFMRLPKTVDGSPVPIGTPTHFITSGDGGAFRWRLP